MSESMDMNGEPLADTIDTGRYLYCLVNTGAEAVDDSALRDTTGIENERVSVVTADDISVGAVVHAQDEPYDSSNLTKLRDWLLAHQQVVEAAGDHFGTPLPVQFDTVLNGNDDIVVTWLDRNADAITDAFDLLAGCWEYRVTLRWDATDFETEQRATDSKLADIDRRLNRSDTGRRFLLQKQYDQRLRELTRQRQAALTETLINRLTEEAIRITERPCQSEAAALLDVDLESNTVAQVAVLASRDNESSLGAALDEILDTPGVDIQFTGPWPPYTFAPTIEED